MRSLVDDVDDFREWLRVLIRRNLELGVFLGHIGEGRSNLYVQRYYTGERKVSS